MENERVILVTGGAGFIGSHLVRQLLRHTNAQVVNLDLLTYAGNLASLADIETNPRYHFRQANISEPAALQSIFAEFQPSTVVHLAAESHVDRSIAGPDTFIETNVIGTYHLLQVTRERFETLDAFQQDRFRFIHISTDEIFGSLDLGAPKFNEHARYQPRSPYSASKAAADHFVRAWRETFGLPTIVAVCSNNFGPNQHLEKLIPKSILHAVHGRPIPIYGDGQNIRDWLYVVESAAALLLVCERGQVGETYLIGGEQELTNLELVTRICQLMDEIYPASNNPAMADLVQAGMSYANLIQFVEDRKGHDFRYALDCRLTKNQLGWRASSNFDQQLKETVAWYVQQIRVNSPWIQRALASLNP
ncbi:MAG TPA: dTDP-glucose 4,6-dehydratase [Pirellulaceae bacterium]|nr:dTDP-glucose 4,6-dehydratase [Pirellulaceae bacterium]HMO92502.1 dTDP-glucose 4,6-dehydratase [Pirellulaceae bacterium]HMP69015.1 dTDP-glucose 4,6-dehydratase [Pirellulaceae bacterium]